MFRLPTTRLSRAMRLAALASGLALAPAAALAGQCPAGKTVPSGRGQANSDAAASGVTDAVIASQDLAHEPIAIPGRLFRLRKLVVQPGGVVPWHSHGNRPAIIYIVEGDIVEYASTCAVPIVHHAGEATAETHATAHWWKNLGSRPAVLISADLFPVNGDSHMM